MSIVAAVLLHDGQVPDAVSVAVSSLPNVKHVKADTAVCRAFQTVRLPMLALYNADGDETARAFGDMHVQELIRQTAAEA